MKALLHNIIYKILWLGVLYINMRKSEYLRQMIFFNMFIVDIFDTLPVISEGS